jgi:hypothetical protein
MVKFRKRRTIRRWEGVDLLEKVIATVVRHAFRPGTHDVKRRHCPTWWRCGQWWMGNATWRCITGRAS